MKRLIRAAVVLYPREWRERYGEEFDALLEDARADWRQLWNVLRVAMELQFLNYTTYLKVVAALSLAGALTAMAVSYRVPPRYVSSAVIRVTPQVTPGQTAAPDVLQRQAEDRVHALQVDSKGRGNLLRILNLPGLDLYSSERGEMPLEDVAQQIGDDGDLQIVPVHLPGRNGAAFRISFAYRDKRKARAVVQDLVRQLRQGNDALNQEKAKLWANYWGRPIPFTQKLDLLDAPSLPTWFPLLVRIAVGCALGMLVAVAALFVRHRLRLLLAIAVCGLAGCAVAAALSLLITERYTARFVLRMSAPFDPIHVSGSAPAVPLSAWGRRLSAEILSPDNVRRTLQDPRFGPAAAGHFKDWHGILAIRSMESSPEADGGPAIEVTCVLPDKVLARQLAVDLVSQLQTRDQGLRHDLDAKADERIRYADEKHLGQQFEIAVNAKAAEELPSTHYRAEVTAAGALLGILAGIFWWKRSDNLPVASIVKTALQRWKHA